MRYKKTVSRRAFDRAVDVAIFGIGVLGAVAAFSLVFPTPAGSAEPAVTQESHEQVKPGETYTVTRVGGVDADTLMLTRGDKSHVIRVTACRTVGVGSDTVAQIAPGTAVLVFYRATARRVSLPFMPVVRTGTKLVPTGQSCLLVP